MSPVNKNTKETAHDRLQDLILSMEIRPGEQVTELALSKRLGIGRTPVREALKKLEQEGLIETKNRRKRVYVLTIKEVEEIFEIKICLETEVVRNAAMNCNEKDCKELKKLIDSMKAMASQEVSALTDQEMKDRLNKWMKIDRKLHHYLFHMADNHKIEQIVKSLDLQWQRLRIGMYTLEGRIERSYKEHAEFVEAVIEHKPEEASKAMREHLGKVSNELVRLFKMFHYPVS